MTAINSEDAPKRLDPGRAGQVGLAALAAQAVFAVATVILAGVTGACALWLLSLYLGIGVLGTEMLLTKIFATGLVFLWNYAARNYFVFRP